MHALAIKTKYLAAAQRYCNKMYYYTEMQCQHQKMQDKDYRRAQTLHHYSHRYTTVKRSKYIKLYKLNSALSWGA